MQSRHWLLSCGHNVPMLEHDRPDVLPSRPRMCGRCATLRGQRRPARASSSVKECGAGSEDGAGWKAEVAPDLLERQDEDEIAVYFSECWRREFSGAGGGV